MNGPIDTVRKLLLAHQADDGEAFRTAIRDLVAEEKRKSHHVVARELERLLDGGGEVHRLRPFRTLFAWENDIPTDGDRGLPLLTAYQPARELDELVLDEQIRTGLDRFVDQAGRADLLRAHGVAPPTRMLLCGPPGCGKTSVAEAVARALLLPLAVVRFDVVVSSYLGETAGNLRKIFDFVATRPMVVLFDEFDAIAKQRDDDFEHGELKRVVNAFLQLLDGLRGDNVIIAATNHQGLLDRAVWRRFDEVLRLDLPTDTQRRDVLLRSLRGIPLAGLPDWQDIAVRTAGYAHADLERVAQMAVRETILASDTAISARALTDAFSRYQARMAVVGAAQPATSDRPPSRVGGESGHAAPQEQSTSSPPANAGGGKPDAVSKAADGRGKAKASRSRATRPVRPRDREAGGAAGDRDEEEGSRRGR